MGKTSIEVFTHSINFMSVPLGECYGCLYCHRPRIMKRFQSNFQKGVYMNRLDELDSLRNASVFLDSMFDICHPSISDQILEKFFKRLQSTPKSNTLVLLTKNPKRFQVLIEKKLIPKNVFLGATIETDFYEMQGRKFSNAPPPLDRIFGFAPLNFPNKLLFIEPILKFTPGFLNLIRSIKNLSIIVIGANSRPEIKLIEPHGLKLQELILELKRHYKVILKKNVSRLKIKPDWRVIRLKPKPNMTLFDF